MHGLEAASPALRGAGGPSPIYPKSSTTLSSRPKLQLLSTICSAPGGAQADGGESPPPESRDGDADSLLGRSVGLSVAAACATPHLRPGLWLWPDGLASLDRALRWRPDSRHASDDRGGVEPAKDLLEGRPRLVRVRARARARARLRLGLGLGLG